jgi:hypothetical protein
MATSMTRPRFERLARVCAGLLDRGYPCATQERPGVAGLFLPSAGRCLGEVGGIYGIGAATEGAYGAEGDQGFAACHETVARLCDRGPHGHAHTPLWLFCDGPTRALLDGPLDGTADRRGWSNLPEIGWSAGTPEGWPRALLERRQAARAAAPREEVSRLHRSLVFMGSLEDFGILGEALGGAPDWHGEHDAATGVWWFRDDASGNLFVHGCHPVAARQGPISEVELDRTVLLARNLLPRFV